MKRVWPIVATIAALTAACLATATTYASASDSTGPPARQVTLVLAPYLTWGDISPTSTPAIWRLAENGALAGVNARSRVREPGQGATPIEGALAISAGAWALPEWSAQPAYTATEPVAGGTAADAYQRIFGASMDPARIAYLGLPLTARANDKGSVDILLGTLGGTIREAGGLTAAIGNSDIGFSASDAILQRPAAIAAMDTSGLVPYGDVSVDLLTSSVSAPYGRSTDLNVFEAELDRVMLLVRAHRGPSFVVLDAGDLSRARDFSWQASDEVVARQRGEALKALDDVVAMADERRGADGVVILASQALYADAGGAPQGLGPLVIAGPGYSGYATSSSTHRRGLVTNLDITATVLEDLGLQRPVQVLGNPMTTQPGPAAIEARVERLNRTNDAFVAIDSVKMTVAQLLLGLTLTVFGLTVLASWLAPRLSDRAVRAWVSVLQGGLLLVLAIPAASWLALLAVPAPPSSGVALAAFGVTALVLATAAFLSARRLPLRVPVAGLALLTSFALIAEQLLGAPLSVVGLISYSPLLGARYYGMGNEAAAIAFGATVVGVALLLDQWPDSPASEKMRGWGIAVLGVLFVAVAAAPFLGANVGVAIWGTTGFAVAWLLFSGRAITAKRVAVTAMLVVVVIAAFSAFDLFGSGEQTHLGRALSGAGQGGLGTLWTIVARKADANARVLSTTGLTWILAAVVGLAVFARWRPGSDWPALMASNPHFAKAVAAVSVAGVVAFFSEDSGIAIPALMALYVGVALAWLMVARLGSGGAEGGDDG
jgi:hypothetical protein